MPVYDSIEHAVEVLAALSERGEFAQRDASAVHAEPVPPNAAMQRMIVARAKRVGTCSNPKPRICWLLMASTCRRNAGLPVPPIWTRWTPHGSTGR